METILTILEASTMVLGFMAVPVVVMFLLDLGGWRDFFTGASFKASSYMMGISLKALRATGPIALVVSTMIEQGTKLNQIRALNWHYRPIEVTWWLDAFGFMVLGLAACAYVVIRRRTPCLKVGNMAVEFHRADASKVEVHVKRKSWWSFHALGQMAPANAVNLLPQQLWKHQLAPALGAALHPTTLFDLQNLGIKRIEIYSPLLNSPRYKDLQKHLGIVVNGFGVSYETFRLALTESVILLVVWPLTRFAWLQEHVRWIKDQSLLVDRVSFAKGIRPQCNGLVVRL
ncbi:hypothetical protein RQP54_17965 [Curvibacter sp. APW13]|uniref:hypothetical protein n=1 Tax=Curvibacter sp. APW13 TaxID=3077236 RepID=UPI0028E07B2E|nr:hypothetical protein [Curvibacter sp. APW13]MDT8992764.1 hypothetical protein [Curvibacter sp. APW13]